MRTFDEILQHSMTEHGGLERLRDEYLEVEEAAERRQRAGLGEQEDQEGSRDPEKSVSGPPVPTLCRVGLPTVHTFRMVDVTLCT